ncbi:substrate-binding domain-containing protein [Streptomyces sp. HSW2009]|uniref:substrate-binding domain-containing protein n=1 Tax=Streptomyces sp. HSW2009 TaxID=3142890 RepID=UPI0032EBC351
MPACDPGGGDNLALLVGVPEYARRERESPDGVPGDLLAVRRNLVELAAALRAGGVFTGAAGAAGDDRDGGPDGTADGPPSATDDSSGAADGPSGAAAGGGRADGGGAGGGVLVVEPAGVDDFNEVLREAAAGTHGVLLFYFAGHGAVPSSGSELWLQLPWARTVPGAQHVFAGSVSLTEVFSVLRTSPARQIVVVLDCCYAGNALRVLEAFEPRQRFFLVTAVQANRRIDAGPADTPTPFTTALLDVLRSARPGRPVTFARLGPALRRRMAGQRTFADAAWQPQTRQGDPDADVVLARTSVADRGPRDRGGHDDRVSSDTRDSRDSRDSRGSEGNSERSPSDNSSPSDAGSTNNATHPSTGDDLNSRSEGEPDDNPDAPASEPDPAPAPASPRWRLRSRPRVRARVRVRRGGRPRERRMGRPREGPRTRPRARSRPLGHEPGPARQPGDGPRWPRGRRWLVAGVAVGAVLALVGTLLHVFGRAPAARICAPPQELRVLTDPDLHRVVRTAAQTYTLSAANHPDGSCARVGITVYAARTSDVITAFHDLSNVWQRPPGHAVRPTDAAAGTGAGAGTPNVPSAVPLDPQRDVGAQPDLWIPATAADATRATEGSQDVDLGTPSAPFGYSPTVLALPAPSGARTAAPRARDGRPTGRGDRPTGRDGRSAGPVGGPLSRLVRAFLDAGAGRQVRRPDPESTDAALLATRALYGDEQAGSVERRLAHGGPLASDGAGLLCALADDREADRSTAAIVPEYLLRAGELDCRAQTRVPRRAVYPDDVPALAPVAVSLTWEGSDQDSATARTRRAGLDGFARWLAGPAGQRVFRAAGFWSKDGRPPPGGGVGPVGGPHPIRDPAAPDDPAGGSLGDTLDRYRAANGPGRVLYLLDASPSMAGVWEGAAGAPALLARAMDDLGPRDEYGAWRVAAPARAERPYDTGLLEFGPHKDRTAARRGLADRARLTEHEADPYGALRAAVAELARRGAGDERPALVVLRTDDEDNGRPGGQQGLPGLLGALRKHGVPVAVVSFSSRGCDRGQPDQRIAEASAGVCLDQRDDRAAGLRDAVAQAAEGDQGDAA